KTDDSKRKVANSEYGMSSTFMIVFEKKEENHNNELVVYDLKEKKKTTIVNECWKYNLGCTYCYNEEKDDVKIYRVGGEKDKEKSVGSIEYSTRNNKVTE